MALEEKLKLLKKNIGNKVKVLLERNMFIFFISIILFYFLFLAPGGVIKSYYDFNVKNHNLQKEIKNYEIKLALLSRKLHCLKTHNKDLLEEIVYVYSNKDPYGSEKKVIKTSKIKDQ